MRRAIGITGLILLMCLASPAWASKKGDALLYLQQELLSLDIGFGGARVFKGSENANLGFLGGNYERVFAGSPEALRLAKSYRAFNIGGFVTMGLGLASTLTVLIMVGAESSAAVNRSKNGFSRLKPLSWALLSVGVVLSVTGPILIGVGGSRLSKAVRVYNRSKVEEVRRRWSLMILPTNDGVVSSFALQF